MKKIMLIFALVGLFSCGYCQEVGGNNSNPDTAIDSENDHDYRIFGVSSAEDIGGVSVVIQYNLGKSFFIDNDCGIYAVLTNHHSYPVQVLYETGYTKKNKKSRYDGRTGVVVIGANGEVQVQLERAKNAFTQYHTSYHYIKAMIVRRFED